MPDLLPHTANPLSADLASVTSLCRRRTGWQKILVVLVAVTLMAAACGSSGDEAAPVAEAVPAAIESVEPTNAAEPESTEPAGAETVEPEATVEPEPEPTEATDPEPTAEPAESADPLVIETTLGLVRGRASSPDVTAWTAIPFVAAPTGENRWREPQPHPGWTDEFDATNGGLMCPQPGGDVTTAFLVSPDVDEDCLTLSVWAPAGEDPLPVMVWIHGGGLTSGSAHQTLYEGTDLATEGVVMVGINYRLGTLGFLAHPDAKSENSNGRTGNYGIMDQQAALAWIQDNIAAFGGDPNNVTLFGESAGGFSICAHLASSASVGLFHKAVIESGGGCQALVAQDDAFAATSAFVADSICADAEPQLACMREMPVEELAISGGPSSLVADGSLLDEPAIELARRGELNDVAIVTGSNRDEFTLFTLGASEPTSAELQAGLPESLSGNAAEILELYSDESFATNLEIQQALSNDLVFTCSAEQFAQDLASAGGTVYRYFYQFVPDPDPIGLGATHGAELVPLFGNPAGISLLPPEFDPATAQISAELQTAWTTFAADGAPQGQVEWLPTNDGSPQVMVIDTDWAPVAEIRAGRCSAIIDIWNR